MALWNRKVALCERKPKLCERGVAELSRDVRSFLKYPDKLFRRVRDEKGVLRLSRAAQDFHPGQGVYRSSYKNALRLTATETNMAYRTADSKRWQQMEWVLGIRISVSKTNHPVTDICDELQGDYPKDFVFTGWHPFCKCFAVAIQPPPEKFLEYLNASEEEKEDWQWDDEVKDVPDKFKGWVKDNPGADHRPFWNTILPIDHPFWNEHRPGDRWNCKCDLTSTDEPPTAVPASFSAGGGSTAANNPQPGLKDNPGKTQAVFSDDHPYFPADCKHCPFYKPGIKASIANIFRAQQEKHCNNCPFINACIERVTEPVTPKTNKELFRFLQEEAREAMNDHTPLNMVDKRFYTGRLIYTHDDVDAILWHAFDDEELNAAQQLHLLITKLKDGKYLPIDMSRKNYKRKIKEGVRHFVLYEVTIDEIVYELKCEAIKRTWNLTMEERPYSLKKRKTE